MAAQAGPKVSAVVDEENGVVSVGVEFDGQFLPVASKSLDYAKAAGLDKNGQPAENDDAENGS